MTDKLHQPMTDKEEQAKTDKLHQPMTSDKEAEEQPKTSDKEEQPKPGDKAKQRSGSQRRGLKRTISDTTSEDE